MAWLPFGYTPVDLIPLVKIYIWRSTSSPDRIKIMVNPILLYFNRFSSKNLNLTFIML